MKFSIYLNRLVFVMGMSRRTVKGLNRTAPILAFVVRICTTKIDMLCKAPKQVLFSIENSDVSRYFYVNI